MSSPDRLSAREFDPTIGRSLKNWGARQTPPADARATLLRRAGRQRQVHPGRSWFHTAARLLAAAGLNPAQRPAYTDLSRWLFSQAMLQNLRTDRSGLRFVS